MATPDFSPFRHMNDIEGLEPEGIFVDAKTGEPILLRADNDYWVNPFALKFIPVRDLSQNGYQDYVELFETDEEEAEREAGGAKEAGAPGY
ncbi:peptide methionine sulfoxide reductase [Bdellovibrio bacteriovorus]|uniref:Putative peptide methionine sulfoxide reductase n=2 Tax=Bdellovibrio bacteriovorus TaxID=959 RepID=Q6MJI9_BDEBA|nr:peptide methionine sulfoxide reductase [Bdellovibrio bacteriovorus]AHZ85280.1 peptide methionine sulfoxide reductase [Bdellovibrio bacteriovorus]BEV69173.1 hypothetical protein Bb109J_c2593 [Bdellovibrio bacteriovorus]CAE80571.1 putative peptide methionine sulfoxide reductase [Bdellovibrio bacteriovorus HD100]